LGPAGGAVERPPAAPAECAATPVADRATVDADPPDDATRSDDPVGPQQGRRELEDLAAEAAENPTEPTAAGGPQVPETGERLLLLVPGGPLIVDLILTVEGQAHDAALRRIVSEEMAAADLDADGQTTWREVANHTPFRHGQFRYAPIPIISRFDGNRDGLVSYDELLRFLMRNVGIAQSFALRCAGEYPYEEFESRIGWLLDDDGDGVLTLAEADQAESRLLRADADDDQVLRPDDLRSGPPRPPSPMSRRSPDQPAVALWLRPPIRGSDVWYTLSERYALGGPLGPEHFRWSPEVGAALDADDDAAVSQEELRRLAEVPAQLVVRAGFGPPLGSRGPPAAQLRLERIAQPLRDAGATVAQYGGRLAIALPGVQIRFFVNEDPMLYNAPLEAIDSNRDGKIGEYELASFLDRQQPACRALLRAWATTRDQSLLATLDPDADGTLTARELHQASARLRSLDHDGDGRLQPQEMPFSLVVALLRGNPLRDHELFVVPASARPADGQVPAWFTAMDNNRDGEISRREFLGAVEQFEGLDRDRDGYLAPDEGRRAAGAL
jgi:Ca2+-binding EF-hand superfamily protein